MASTPDVFIIESLRSEDREAGRCEGDFLSHILRLEKKRASYCYIRTEREMKVALEQFAASGFRYLHVSCHGDEDGIELTDGELTVKKLGRLLRPFLRKRRVFFSACGLVRETLAQELLTNTECHSVIGPASELSCGEAAIFWASFYHLMLKKKATGMRF